MLPLRIMALPRPPAPSPKLPPLDFSSACCPRPHRRSKACAAQPCFRAVRLTTSQCSPCCPRSVTNNCAMRADSRCLEHPTGHRTADRVVQAQAGVRRQHVLFGMMRARIGRASRVCSLVDATAFASALSWPVDGWTFVQRMAGNNTADCACNRNAAAQMPRIS